MKKWIVLGLALLLASCYWQEEVPLLEVVYPGYFAIKIMNTTPARGDSMTIFSYAEYSREVDTLFPDGLGHLEITATKINPGEYVDHGPLKITVSSHKRSTEDIAPSGDGEASVIWQQ